MAAISVSDEQSVPRPAAGSYARYVLTLLFLANAFNQMDRTIVSVLIEPIKRDLHLSDTQMGIISGLGYALIYALIGLAIAPIVDRGSRKGLLAGGVALWSVMTALTGMSAGFLSMLAARLGIAAGEATCYPTSLSLIGDYFEPSRRSRAIAVFQLGTYAGLIGGTLLASLVAAHFGWRAAFSVLGLPGLVLAVLIWLTLREPAHGALDREAGELGAIPQRDRSAPAMMLRLIVTNRRFALLTTCSITMAIAQVTMGVWVPPFLMRVHGISQMQVGTSVPFIGLSGVFGTVVGGFLGTRIARRSRDERAPLLVMLWSAPLAIPGLMLFLFAPSFLWSVVGGVFGVFFIAMHFGPLVAVIIGTVEARHRGTATSLLTAGQFLIGLGLGPLIVGLVSDMIEPSLHGAALRYAMLLAPAMVALSWLFCLVGYRAIPKRW